MTDQVVRLKERLRQVKSRNFNPSYDFGADERMAGEDKRLAPRKPSKLPGYLKIDGRKRMINCMILDMSATGACIRVEHGDKLIKEDIITLPEYIRLYIIFDKVFIDCKIVWRRVDLDQIGVRFMSPAKAYS